MRKIFACIFCGLTALILSPLPFIVAIYGSARGEGSISECSKREWKNWVKTLDEMVS